MKENIPRIMSKLPYASPDEIVPNKCRCEDKSIKLFVIRFETKNKNNGMAVVAAIGANSAINILRGYGELNGAPEEYQVYLTQEISGATYSGPENLITELII